MSDHNCSVHEHTYKLFVMQHCPYCVRVQNYLDSNNIRLPTVDIEASQDAYDELERVGGKIQVPCLFIDGEPMYESADIIDYFRRMQDNA